MKKNLVSLIILILFFSGCQTTIPREALLLSTQSLQIRQLQTRVFDTSDEEKLLIASAGLLQDLGFNIDESDTELGFILGTKYREATDAAQVAGAIILALAAGVVMPVDESQKMRACIVTRPFGESKEKIAVRVTFQRIVWNTQGQVTKKEGIEDPEIYQEFFFKLSKAVFLEANQL